MYLEVLLGAPTSATRAFIRQLESETASGWCGSRTALRSADRHHNETSWTMSWASAALPRMRCSKAGPVSDPTSVVWAFARLGRIPKILDLAMEPVAVSHISTWKVTRNALAFGQRSAPENSIQARTVARRVIGTALGRYDRRKRNRSVADHTSFENKGSALSRTHGLSGPRE